jgi:hypothetical protein
MHSFVIDYRPCPRCQNQRTARFGAVRFCFNCRSQPKVGARIAYPFTTAELARLHAYRAAIRAGLYSDM